MLNMNELCVMAYENAINNVADEYIIEKEVEDSKEEE